MSQVNFPNPNNDKIRTRVNFDDDIKVEEKQQGILDTMFYPQKYAANAKVIKRHDDALLAWAREGFLDGVKYVAELGVSKIALNRSLLVSASNGSINVAKSLIEDFGAQVNINSSLPLKLAVKHGHKEMVDFLITKGAFVNSDYGEALNYATKSNDLPIVKSLVRAGANVSVERGKIFVNAIKNNNSEMVEFLMSGKPTEDTLIVAFYEAVKSRKPEIAKVVASNMEVVSPELVLLFENIFDQKLKY